MIILIVQGEGDEKEEAPVSIWREKFKQAANKVVMLRRKKQAETVIQKIEEKHASSAKPPPGPFLKNPMVDVIDNVSLIFDI